MRTFDFWIQIVMVPGITAFATWMIICGYETWCAREQTPDKEAIRANEIRATRRLCLMTAGIALVIVLVRWVA